MLFRKLVVVGLAGVLSFAANIATAEDAVAPVPVGIDGVSFADPTQAFGDRFQIGVGQGEGSRFANLAPYGQNLRNDDASRHYEVVVATGAAGFDVSFAQRGGVGFNREGDIERRSRSSELRLGRGLRQSERDRRSSGPSWYFFAASEDEALVWRPGVRTDFGGVGSSFALQDQVEIGDLQAGITYEHNGWQASIAYVEREFSVRNGSDTISQDENFAGFTLTYRH